MPFNVVNVFYYQHVINGIIAIGPSYKGPNFHTRHGYYLAKKVDEVKIFVESYRETWKKIGCTLIADGWTDKKKNFN